MSDVQKQQAAEQKADKAEAHAERAEAKAEAHPDAKNEQHAQRAEDHAVKAEKAADHAEQKAEDHAEKKAEKAEEHAAKAEIKAEQHPDAKTVEHAERAEEHAARAEQKAENAEAKADQHAQRAEEHAARTEEKVEHAEIKADQHAQRTEELAIRAEKKAEQAEIKAEQRNGDGEHVSREPPKLERIYGVKNAHYHRNGLKSYGHALLKYQIAPTKEGPFVALDKASHEGKHGIGNFQIQLPVEGKPHVLMKREDHHIHFTHSTSSKLGEIQASDIQHDAEYLCPVIVGTPGQTLLLDFDTGSADLWVWSTGLSESTLAHYGRYHTVYDPSKSSTSKDRPGFTWQIQYGDGSGASGNIYNDDIKLGGIRVREQAIEMAQNVSSSFKDTMGDGLLGLAFGAINTAKPHPVRTPVERMMKQEEIPANAQLFTAWLGSHKDANEADHGRSFYTFGFIDQDALRMTGVTDPKNIWWTPVTTDKGFWQFPSTSKSINGKKMELHLNTAIADTGTTLALVRDAVCEEIYKSIPGALYDPKYQGYIFPSHVAVDKLPVVEFDVGGKMFTVQKEDLAFAEAGSGMVYGGIQSRGSLPFDIFGDTFLKGIYAIFDQGNKRFGAIQRTERYQNLATK